MLRASFSEPPKSAWDTWNVFPEVTRAFVEITSAPSELSDECTETIETFVVLLYNRGSELSLLIGHDSNCSVHVPVVWIEFLQLLQL